MLIQNLNEHANNLKFHHSFCWMYIQVGGFQNDFTQSAREGTHIRASVTVVSL